MVSLKKIKKKTPLLEITFLAFMALFIAAFLIVVFFIGPLVEV